MAKTLSVAGEVFKDIAEMITLSYGFGTNKMIRRFDLYEWSSIDFNDWHNGVLEAYHFLVEDGWIREYTPTYTVRSRSATNYGQRVRVQTINGVYIGLTEKGWSIAHKYIDRDYIET